MNLWESLRAGAAAAPSEPLLVSPSATITWADAQARADEFAVGLARLGVTRFGVSGVALGELIPLLAAASLVGAEPCVYPADHDPMGLAQAFDHPVFFDHGALQELAIQGTPPQPAGQSPILILTTGTTGEPKGVRHDWHRLFSAARQRADLAGSRWLFAYNTSQFAGFQVILHVMVNHATLIEPASNHPRQAWDTITAHQVTHASATPTFWRFLLGVIEHVPDNLPLRQITLGGEAVPEALLLDLAVAFPQAHISQIYASTEFGSSVSVRDLRDGLPLNVLERDAGVRFRIVDGELHAQSTVGMLGYYRQPDVGGDWLPTGDLVEIRDDRIYFVGRTSEVVNVGGVKVHPLPIEKIVDSVSGVAKSVAYGRPNPIVGAIVALDVIKEPGVDEESLRANIRESCLALPDAARPRSIRFVTTLDIHAGKIRRRVPGE